MTTPTLVGCPYCDKGRYAPDYLPRHIALNHPDVPPPGWTAEDEAAYRRDGRKAMQNR